jgi:hypothetical protein
MYPGLMVRAVFIEAAEVSTSLIHYFFPTYLMMLSKTDMQAQRYHISASDS